MELDNEEPQEEDSLEIEWDKSALLIENLQSMMNLKKYHETRGSPTNTGNMVKPDTQFAYLDGFEGFGFSEN